MSNTDKMQNSPEFITRLEKEYDEIFDPLEAGQTKLDTLAALCHAQNTKWWVDVSGNRIARNKGELIALMHSELSEMLEGVRKSLQDNHLPQFTSEEVELADLLIRAFDYAGGHGLRLGEAWKEKMKYNATREDHKHEARAQQHGKKF